MKRRNREGVFNNAIYSKIVRAAEETDVLLGVEEDLEYITKKNPYDNSRIWNNAPGSVPERTLEKSLPRIRQPGRGLGGLKRKSDFFVTKTIKPSEEKGPQILEDLDLDESSIYVTDPGTRKYSVANHFRVDNETRVEDINIFKKPNIPVSKPRGASLLESPQCYTEHQRRTPPKAFFQSTCHISIDDVAAEVSEYLPKLPLRIGNLLCYADLVSDLCKKSLKSDDTSLNVTKERISTMNETVVRAAKAYSEYMKKSDTMNNMSDVNSESPLTYASFQSTQQSFPSESASMISGLGSCERSFHFEKTWRFTDNDLNMNDSLDNKSSVSSSSNPNSFAFYGLTDPKDWSASRESSNSKSSVVFLEPGFIG